MDRRDFLQLGTLAAGGALAVGRLGRHMSDAALAAANGLKDYARSNGAYVGAGLDHRWAGNPAILARYRQDCSIVTPIYEMKWGTLHGSSSDHLDFTVADAFVNVAQQNNWKIHGHNLISDADANGAAFPKASLNQASAQQLMDKYISAVMTRYKGKIQSWDVVNEILAPWIKSNLLTPGGWLDTLGPRYFEHAFQTAASIDPAAKLVWNEHHLEHDTPDEARCRQTALTMLKGMKSRGVPVQVLGLQSHLRAQDPVGGADFERFLKQVVDMGIEIYITELDVDDTRLQGAPAQRDSTVADIYQKYLESVVRIANPKVIVFWQLSDQTNWIDWDAKSNASHRRPDGSPHRPAPLDSSMQNKPAYNAIVKALQGR